MYLLFCACYVHPTQAFLPTITGDGLDEADEMEVQAAEEEAAAKAKAEVDIIAEALVNESLAMSEEEGGAKDDEPIQAPPPDNDIQAPSTDIESDVPVAMDTE